MLMYPIGAREFRSQSLSAFFMYASSKALARLHRCTGLSELSLFANAMSTKFSREDAIIFRSPCHACRNTEYRKLWLV